MQVATTGEVFFDICQTFDRAIIYAPAGKTVTLRHQPQHGLARKLRRIVVRPMRLGFAGLDSALG